MNEAMREAEEAMRETEEKIEKEQAENEKIKAEMADYLHGLNSCAEIDYSIYSQLFDFSLPLIQKAYELGKKEAQPTPIGGEFHK